VRERVTIAVVTTGSAEENERLRELGVTDVMLQEDAELMEEFRVTGTPSAVIVGTDYSIKSTAVMGVPAIEPLVRTAMRSGARADADTPQRAPHPTPEPIPST